MLIENLMTGSRFTILILALLATACSGEGGSYSPTAPPPSLTPAPATSAWSGLGLVDAVTGPDSCFIRDQQARIGTSIGPVGWSVTQDGSSIVLIEGTQNVPFDHSEWSGSVSGRDFTATLQNYIGASGPFYCPDGSLAAKYSSITGELSGTFSADGRRIEAVSVLRYLLESGGSLEYRFKWTLT